MSREAQVRISERLGVKVPGLLGKSGKPLLSTTRPVSTLNRTRMYTPYVLKDLPRGYVSANVQMRRSASSVRGSP
jgi:hypothetical protein